jgi:hypothetical protein
MDELLERSTTSDVSGGKPFAGVACCIRMHSDGCTVQFRTAVFKLGHSTARLTCADPYFPAIQQFSFPTVWRVKCMSIPFGLERGYTTD